MTLTGDVGTVSSYFITQTSDQQVAGFRQQRRPCVAPSAQVNMVVINATDDNDTVYVDSSVTVPVEAIRIDGSTEMLTPGQSVSLGVSSGDTTNNGGSTGNNGGSYRQQRRDYW